MQPHPFTERKHRHGTLVSRDLAVGRDLALSSVPLHESCSERATLKSTIRDQNDEDVS
jgi:hypothetical protein